MTTSTSSATSIQQGSPSRLRSWPASPAIAMLVLRIAVGAVFIAHGAQKVFVYGFAGTSGSFAEMGVPLASIAGPLVGLLELLGGALLVIGLATRVVALALAADMAIASILVHLPFGIFAAEGGYELTLALAATAIALVFAGAGRFSIDGVVTQGR
ncbi:DoxX family protein [Cryobacterium frigoriphilum]|uniref:DoxX family protein n=1 Tax=Cryobacterium frigoriphilum TaxID=1259150 RepID=A0A4R8ZV75_9MICO|nr:DoxX family protein [Cryobacterium frigoriphilum]TFD46933.1 DoxX family protein [Cryobacterium frigoriphilum]